jgi:hypothetical protein
VDEVGVNEEVVAFGAGRATGALVDGGDIVGLRLTLDEEEVGTC